MTGEPAGSIETRLAQAGLPPLGRTAWIEIDTDALAGNVAAIRALAGPGVQILPVVKADGYGHGMLPAAQVLAGAGVDGLCVATLDEAVLVADADLGVPILVLFPIPTSGVAAAVRRGIGLVGGSLPGIDDLSAAARAEGLADRLSIDLEIETGLGRGGIAPDEVVEAARRIAAGGARFAGVWTHLQEAEVGDITASQVARFEDALARLAAAGIAVPRRHLSASGALLLGNVPRYDAVRPGLITYGIVPEELTHAGIGLDALGRAARDLRPVLSLKARPIRVRDLPAGHGVSYGPTWRAKRPSRIATLPIGYGDGWSRALSNKASVLVRGVRAPAVGNIAMDATMVDVTDIPGPPVGLDDEFVLIGRQGDDSISAVEVAQWRTTNSWEVLTTLSRRLTRVYDAAAGLSGVRPLALENSWPGSSSGMETSVTSRSTPS